MTKPTLFERKAKMSMAYRVYYHIIKDQELNLSVDTKNIHNEPVKNVDVVPHDKIQAVQLTFEDDSFLNISSRGILYGIGRGHTVKSVNRKHFENFDALFQELLLLINLTEFDYNFYDNAL